MESNMNDETRNRRREEALAQRLGEALDQVASSGTENCPDAELIAAYREQELGPEETAQCETHFAACSRCRKILAVLAVSDDTPLAEKEVARLGELVAAARAPREAAPQTSKTVRPIRPDWRVRWLAPALGAAAVLAVWFAMRPPWRTADQGSTGTLVAQGPKTEPLPPAEVPPTDQISRESRAKETDTAASSRISKDQPANKTESAAPASDAPAKKNLDEGRSSGGFAPDIRVAAGAPADEKKARAEANSTKAVAPPPPPPPPSAAMPRPLAEAQSSAAGQAVRAALAAPASTAQSVTVTGEAPAVAAADAIGGSAPARNKQAPVRQGASADQPLNGRSFQALSRLGAVRADAAQIKSPSGKVMWRLGGGNIERSTDGGKAWISQSSPLVDEWLAGAAASDTVCWIVGRSGAIARTTDAGHWEKIAPPPVSADASGKFPDWVNVTATDAKTATITADDQRRFTTHDGGKAWQSK
jgi:hypothetical protein